MASAVLSRAGRDRKYRLYRMIRGVGEGEQRHLSVLPGNEIYSKTNSS